MLEARSRAARGAALSAGSPAREGHRVLSEALRLTPGDPDALFAMGAYNYYADNVGVLLKGLRALLFIPGGDEALGIRQLEEAADRSDLFGTEALLLLSHIFSGSFEEDDRRADAYLQRACARHPRSPGHGVRSTPSPHGGRACARCRRTPCGRAASACCSSRFCGSF